jgi:ubiquinone/menaquinone biosynthesis C-methylase UbiE
VDASILEAKPVFTTSDWEQYATCYDSLIGLTPYRELLVTVVENVLQGTSGKILDASCGTGNFEQTLFGVDGSEAFSVVGIDSSREMLERARNKLRDRKHVELQEADLNKRLPFLSATFDHVVSVNTLYAVVDPQRTLEQFYRVLTLGGQLSLVTPVHGFENGEILRAHCKSEQPAEYWKGVHTNEARETRLVREAFNDDKLADEMILVAKYNRAIAQNGATFHFFQEEELLTLLCDVGFSIQQCSPIYANQAFFITATKL